MTSETNNSEAREYLIRVGSALRYQTRPALDPVRSLGVTNPDRFALLTAAWQRCLDAAHIVHVRYREDSNSGGPLSEIAVEVRDCALSGLARTWEHLVDAYLNDIAEAEKGDHQ